MEILKLPVGIENFEDIRRSGFYYIDKTMLIEQTLNNWSKVTLFTRPRRFGKTLGMSMLRSFFEIGTDKSLFDGLYISQNKSLCDEYMGKYPVIFISLKDVEGLSYDEAFQVFSSIIGNEISKFSFLAESDKLTVWEKEQFKGLLYIEKGKFIFDNATFTTSLKLLSKLLYKHYGKKAVILIDEYDVPLDKAYQNGYYHEMVSLIRGLFGQALKTNDYLQFAILTGCLRISKESSFTGLNNFEIVSIMDSMYDECFGFTDKDVQEILTYFNLSEHYADVKEWYDGYHFGNANVYCPWDVINYVDLLRLEPTAKPQDFWSNSSENALVRNFIDKANVQTKYEIECLIAGEYIEKEISQELTYDEIDKSIANLWSVLFTTGYLTKQGVTDDGRVRLSIPNREIKNLFIKKIREWFSDTTANDGKTLEQFCNAFVDKDTEKIEELFGDYLWNTISIRDTAVAKDKKENFYHGILLGLLGYKASWLIKSNTESGTGYSDILVEVPNNRTGIVIELELLVRAQKEQFEENLEEICKVNDALEEAKIKFAVLKGAFFGCEMYEKGTRRSNDIDLLVYEDDLGKLDTCLRAMGYIQSNMSNGEMVEATKKEKIIQRMNYHDLVPYVKKTKMGILELDINFLFDGNKNLIDKNVYEMGTMVYKGRYRITGLNPYTNLAFLCCHFYREATDTIWTEGKRDVTLYKIVDMMNFIRFYREQINYDIMIEVLKKLNIEKKAYFTFKIMTEFYEYDFLSEMLSRLDEYKSGDDEMKAIHDTKNKTTIYRDETFFEKTFARG